jgi:hypothetical protein
MTSKIYPPTLAYDSTHDAYRLYLPGGERDGASYSMLIKHLGLEEYSARFAAHIDGEEYEVLTPGQLGDRVDAIRENEGPEVAHLWAREQNIIWPERPDHPVFALKATWDAMMTLRLFALPVSHRGWAFRTIPENLRAALDAFRGEWERGPTTTLAVTVERVIEEDAAGYKITARWRAIMFEIDHESGAAMVEAVVEDATARDAAEALCRQPQFEGRAIAIKVDADADGAVPVGNHWVAWPDALSVPEAAAAAAGQ